MKNVKQRKMLLMLPVLVIPFLTMAFWALGGGGKKTESAVTVKGLNLDLPDANLKDDKTMDKLGFYDQAVTDSLKIEEWMRSDPYFKKEPVPDELEELTTVAASKYKQQLNVSPYDDGGNNKPEEKILQKLKLLEMEMNKNSNPIQLPRKDPEFFSEADWPEQPFQLPSSTEDPEMKQLDGTLEKILDIQHPQRVKERSLKNKEAVYAVRRSSGADTIVNGFYSISGEKENEEQHAVEAIIATNQTIVNGAVAKFRIINDIYVNGRLVPKDNIIAGIASLDGERLMIEVSSLRCGKNLIPVKLEVYDMDGLPGIYIPGSISRDAAKESAYNSLSLADITSPDPSLKAQATATGIGAIKSLISKKVKLVKVQIKAGYKVLFKNKNQDQ